MQILDYVIIAFAVIGLIAGVAKGFLKQLFALAGIVVVSIGTAYLFPYPQSWLASAIADSNACAITAMIVTFAVLALVYALVTKLILKLVHGLGVLNVVDRVLGLVLGVAVVYAVFSVFIALLTQTADTFMPWTKSWMNSQLENSVLVGSVFKNNFFGDWLLKIAGEKLPFLLPQ